MNGTIKIMAGLLLIGTTTAAYAHDDGLHLAAGIVHLVNMVIAPRTVVVTPAPAVAATPVVIAPQPCCPPPPPPPHHHHHGPCAPHGPHRPR